MDTSECLDVRMRCKDLFPYLCHLSIYIETPCCCYHPSAVRGIQRTERHADVT